jgi:hypothetical protein
VLLLAPAMLLASAPQTLHESAHAAGLLAGPAVRPRPVFAWNVVNERLDENGHVPNLPGLTSLV